MPDPDLEIRVGGRSSRPLDKGGGRRSPQKNFSALRASVWSKNKGWGGDPLLHPLTRQDQEPILRQVIGSKLDYPSGHDRGGKGKGPTKNIATKGDIQPGRPYGQYLS